MDLKHPEKKEYPTKVLLFISMWKLRYHPPLLPHTFISKADEIELIKTTPQMGLSQGKCFEGRSSQNPRPPPTNPKIAYEAELGWILHLLSYSETFKVVSRQMKRYFWKCIFYSLAGSRYFLELFENCNKLDRLLSPLFWVLKSKWY